MNQAEPLKHGWAKPRHAHRRHYFNFLREGYALCLKTEFYIGAVEVGSDESTSDCKLCIRKLEALKRKGKI